MALAAVLVRGEMSYGLVARAKSSGSNHSMGNRQEHRLEGIVYMMEKWKEGWVGRR